MNMIMFCIQFLLLNFLKYSNIQYVVLKYRFHRFATLEALVSPKCLDTCEYAYMLESILPFVEIFP